MLLTSENAESRCDAADDGVPMCNPRGMHIFASHRLEDTEALAFRLAALVQGGDVVLLLGDLGVGKTAFTKAFARALGVEVPVTSPTFTIMQNYDGVKAGQPIRLLHLDAYRLEGADAVEELGLYEQLDAGAIALIEWGDIVAGAFGKDPLVIEFTWLDENERSIAVQAHPQGPWTDRVGQLVRGGTSC